MIDPGDEPAFPPMSPPEVESLSEEDQERQSALKQEAVDALEDGDRDRALEKFTAAILIGCASAMMYSRRAQILFRQGRPFAAVNDCTAALLLDSDLASAYKTRARALSQLEQWEDARADFEEALRLDYDDVTYQESLKAAAGGAAPEAEAPSGGEPPFPPLSPPQVVELSEEALDEQVGLKQECSDALEDGDVDEALEKISSAIALGCASASMYCTRAELLLRLERPRAAANDCAAALAVDPESARACRTRARALVAQEDWAEAYACFRDALRLAFDAELQAEARLAAGRAGLDVSREAALEPPLEPGDEPPFPPLAPPGVRELSEETHDRQAALKQACAEALEDGDDATALESISGAIALGCASALMYVKRAQVLVQLARPRAAVMDCRAALLQNAHSAKALKIRARAYVAMERWLDARADYDAALKIEDDPVMREESRAVASKLKELEAEAKLAARKKWEIVGGADTGGVVVRDGLDVKSPQILDPLDGVTPHRLATGAVVAEVELVNDRLHFQKLKGVGPREGWISIALKDKVLAIPLTAEAPLAGAGGPEGGDAPAEEPPFPPMSPSRVEELTDEGLARQAEFKQQAADAQEDGDLPLALEKFTAAIALGCASALLYSRRAQLLLQLGRPRAAINDCTAALQINPDSGKAFKLRARGHVKLKHWADAHADFQEGLRIDYDEETYEESVSVEAKMKGMKAVAAEKRILVEQDRERRKKEEEKAAEELRKQNERMLAQSRSEEDRKMRMFEKMYMSDQFGRVAWQQGYMTDFMGVKRGKSKGGKCPIYCWTPVRLSS